MSIMRMEKKRSLEVLKKMMIMQMDTIPTLDEETED